MKLSIIGSVERRAPVLLDYIPEAHAESTRGTSGLRGKILSDYFFQTHFYRFANGGLASFGEVVVRHQDIGLWKVGR